MDKRFLRIYEKELQHLRETASEFSKEFPKIAGRLGFDGLECNDPYVERLLEGFAFLASRVQLKLDSEFPRFTQNLLESVYPHYLAQTPSMAIVQYEPDPSGSGMETGYVISRDISLRSNIGTGEQTACEFRTCHDTVLWPVTIVEAEYHTRDVGSLDLPKSLKPKAAIRIRLQTLGDLPFSEISMDELVLYLQGPGQTPMRLYEQFFAHAFKVLVRPVTRPAPWTHIVDAEKSLRQIGFAQHESMLPFDARSFQGYRLLHEYFTFPQRYMFVGLGGLSGAFQERAVRSVDVIVLMDEEDVDLENVIDHENFALNCAPVVNLFPKRADRIHITDKYPEYHVVPDRTRPLDFEVYRILSVTGLGSSVDHETEFRPFYSASDYDQDSEQLGGAYFAVNRIGRVLSTKERRRGRRSSYSGSEVFISIVDSVYAPYRPDLRQLALNTLCTNRDLPLQMPVGAGVTDFTLETDAPINATRVIAGPTAPQASHAEGDLTWRLISHFSLNHHSLCDDEKTHQGAEALRTLLRLYGDGTQAHIRKQIEGVRSITSKPITRRVPSNGPIAFARGLEVQVTFDEMGFEGVGAFLLGAVLEQFMSRYVTMNSFTETSIHSTDRGVIKRWPARLGQTSML